MGLKVFSIPNQSGSLSFYLIACLGNYCILRYLIQINFRTEIYQKSMQIKSEFISFPLLPQKQDSELFPKIQKQLQSHRSYLNQNLLHTKMLCILHLFVISHSKAKKKVLCVTKIVIALVLATRI